MNIRTAGGVQTPFGPHLAALRCCRQRKKAPPASASAANIRSRSRFGSAKDATTPNYAVLRPRLIRSSGIAQQAATPNAAARPATVRSPVADALGGGVGKPPSTDGNLVIDDSLGLIDSLLQSVVATDSSV